MVKIDHESLYLMYERFLLDNFVYKGGQDNVTEQLKEEFLGKALDFHLRTDTSMKIIDEIKKAYSHLGVPYIQATLRATTKVLPGSSAGLGFLITDIGINWDPLLDLPYIPGSTLKGAVRSFAESLISKRSSSENLGDVSKLVESLFGKPGEDGFRGPLIFHDAYPVSGRVLDMDLINPHYNAEVGGIRSELDVQPKPVKHLVIGSNIEFSTIISPSVNSLDEETVSSVRQVASLLGVGPDGSVEILLLKIVAYLLGGALEIGVGGRTLKGYGKLEVVGLEVKLHG